MEDQKDVDCCHLSSRLGGETLKRGLVFLVILSLLLCGQAVQAKEETEWKTISKVTKKGTTYSLLQNKQSDELYFVKEERVKGKRVE